MGDELDNAVPIGTIFRHYGRFNEAYLPLIGQRLSTKDYPDLFRKIKYAYTEPSEVSIGHFDLPNWKGFIIKALREIPNDITS